MAAKGGPCRDQARTSRIRPLRDFIRATALPSPRILVVRAMPATNSAMLRTESAL